MRTPLPPITVCLSCKKAPPRSTRADYCQPCFERRARERRIQRCAAFYARAREQRYAGRKCQECGEPIPLEKQGNFKRCDACTAKVYRQRARVRSGVADREDPPQVRACVRCRTEVPMHARQRMCDACAYRSTRPNTPERARMEWHRKMRKASAREAPAA